MLDPFSYLALAFLAFFTGLLDASIGGGGLVLVPALTFAGELNILQAIGSARLSFVIDSLSAVYHYNKKRLVVFSREVKLMSLGVAIGALIGTNIAVRIPLKSLEIMFAVFMIIMATLIYLKPTKMKQHGELKKMIWITFPCSIIVGALIGLFGAGLGVVTVFLLVYVLDFQMLQAVGTSRIIVASGNAVAFLSYFFMGVVNLPLALYSAVFAGLGAGIGTWVANKLGNENLKRLFVLMVILLALKVLLSS